MYLVGSPKQVGYLSALKKTWITYELQLDEMPSKSSLSEARVEISFVFFKDLYEEQVVKVAPLLPKVRGFKVYGIDGDQLELPASENILFEGYRGFFCKNNMETHYPRMYYTAKTEVFSGVIVDVRQSIQNDECKNAVDMALETESNSISLYDRLHFSIALAKAHETSKSFYIARLKSGNRVLIELQDFIKSKRKAKKVEIDGIKIRFLRVKNPVTKELMFLATNLPRSLFKPRELQWLYWRRYDVETVFRDLTSVHSLGVWHSTKINGILQEFYLQFYIHNCSRFLVLSNDGIEVIEDWKTGEYRRPNFKLIREHFIDNIKMFIKKLVEKFQSQIKILIQKSMELRTYFSRMSPRQVKYSKNTYDSASLVNRRS
jgi:hypothetical protein